MKISVAISLLIVALAALLGWKQHVHFGAIQKTHEELESEARGLGISAGFLEGAEGVMISKRGRGDGKVDTRALAGEMISFLSEMERLRESGQEIGVEERKRINDVMERMMALDAKGMKLVIEDLLQASGFSEEARNGMVGWALRTMASDYPAAALNLLTEISGSVEGSDQWQHVASNVLQKLAAQDPHAALEWVRKNVGKFPDLVTDHAKSGLIRGVASSDPAYALRLMRELNISDHTSVIAMAARSAHTPEKRGVFLRACRENLGHLDEAGRKEAMDAAIFALSGNVVKEGFEHAQAWFAEAGVSPEEMKQVAFSIGHSIRSEDMPRWLGWAHVTFPNDGAKESVGSLLRIWTNKDFRASGGWIAAQPDGPLKHLSIQSYAESVARYEPHSAAEWAMTLPDQDQRQETLRNIYQSWPQKDLRDKVDREAFKARHGF